MLTLKASAAQRRFSPTLFFAVIVFVFLIQILAIDMYVPALPEMQREFAISAAYLNITVFVFLVAQAIAMVASGPISDRFGRRAVYIGGCGLFFVGSLACAFTPNVEGLFVARAVEALGFGCTPTLSAALVKDAYEGEDLKLTMTLLQSLIIIGPVLAPFLGSFMTEWLGWRAIFDALSIAGALTVILALLIDETYRADMRAGLGLAETFRQMGRDSLGLVRNRGFTTLALFIGVTAIPFFAFIAVSSYIILEEFSLGYLDYSVVYAIAAIANCIAPYVYLLIARRLSTRQVMLVCVGFMAASSIMLTGFGSLGAAALLIGFIPYALAEGIARPGAYLVLLDQPPAIIGTASAFSNFTYGIITAFATVAATLPWPTMLFGLITLMIASTLGSGALYLLGHRRW